MAVRKEGPTYTFIKDLKPTQTGLNVMFIVLQQPSNHTTTREGYKLWPCKIADRTATIDLTVWGEDGQFLRSGDIYSLTCGHCSLHRGRLTLYVGRRAQLTRLGEFCFLFTESLNMSDPNNPVAKEFLNSVQEKSQQQAEKKSQQQQAEKKNDISQIPLPPNISAADPRRPDRSAQKRVRPRPGNVTEERTKQAKTAPPLLPPPNLEQQQRYFGAGAAPVRMMKPEPNGPNNRR